MQYHYAYVGTAELVAAVADLLDTAAIHAHCARFARDTGVRGFGLGQILCAIDDFHLRLLPRRVVTFTHAQLMPGSTVYLDGFPLTVTAEMSARRALKTDRQRQGAHSANGHSLNLASPGVFIVDGRTANRGFVPFQGEGRLQNDTFVRRVHPHTEQAVDHITDVHGGGIVEVGVGIKGAVGVDDVPGGTRRGTGKKTAVEGTAERFGRFSLADPVQGQDRVDDLAGVDIAGAVVIWQPFGGIDEGSMARQTRDDLKAAQCESQHPVGFKGVAKAKVDRRVDAGEVGRLVQQLQPDAVSVLAIDSGGVPTRAVTSSRRQSRRRVC